ncbi:MAG: hypothetical protein IKG98_11125 [Ruminococcus sp.]|nr:hypothetical protein [Ruminococcus sp.]MBR5164675.1 hypothetical protein [Ruminococcus sp.]
MLSPDTIMFRVRHRNWTAKDFAIVAVAMVLYVVLRLTLPKIIKNVDDKLLDRISFGAAILAMLALMFAT